MTRSVESLSPEEVLALAVRVEQANARRFRAFADVFQGYEPVVAARFEELAAEEDEHEVMLTERFKTMFGETIPGGGRGRRRHRICRPRRRRAPDLRLAATARGLQAGASGRGRCSGVLPARGGAKDAELAKLYRELAEMEEDHAGW